MPARTETATRLVRAAAHAAGLGERSDPELLAAFLTGESAAFEALVRRHGPMVLRTCRAATRCEADADDAFQTTFVLLYRQAASVRDRRSLAGWLFRVARRAAGNARRAADRRARRQTATATARPVADSPPDLSWREACSVLHAEIDRLPEAYRLPLVLCYLQGLARDEAARRLGWSLNEVRGRLERGRSRLRGRLLKRGITLSAGLLGAVAADAVPPALVRSTLTAARSARPGAVVALAAGLWKAGLAAGLATAIVVGLALQPKDVPGQPAREKPKAVAEAPKKAEPEAPRTVTVSGMVVGTGGSGVCMAKVIVRRQDQKNEEGVTAATDPGGRFQATVPAIPGDAVMVAISVGRDGIAGGWQTWAGPPPKELRLVEVKDDVPVQGRVLDLEGKPVAGVTVAVQGVHAFPDGSPQAFADWLTGTRPRPAQSVLHGTPPGATATAVTGADGKFKLTGIGRGRVVQLVVTGPAIGYENIYVATAAKLADPGGRRANRTYPATFDHVVSPARPIRGTVRDADTGKPVAGFQVNGSGGAATATTDQDGRYELPGYKKGPRYSIYARPADGSAYFPTLAETADTGGLDPLEIDLKAKAGVPVRGRLTDPSGKPVVGTVRYWALAGNDNVLTVPVGARAGEYYTIDVRTKADGTFTCAALAGPGFLSVTADGWYRAARVDPAGHGENTGLASTADQLTVAVGGMALTTISQEAYQGIRLLQIDPAKPPGEQVIELTPAEPVRGRFVDLDGKPLAGVKARGLHQSGDFWSEPLPAAEFTARSPHPDRPRRLTFRHDGRKLVGTALVTAGSREPVEFKLEPWASATGRLLDADGRPVARASVYVPGAGRDRRAAETAPIGTVFTDAAGRFTLDGLLPGVPYRLSYREFQPARRGGPVTDEFTLKPGEERNLGELKMPAREP